MAAPPAPIIPADVRQLLASLEHDLKNPVGNILGYLSLLRDDPDSPLSNTQADFLSRIEQNCQSILQVLEQIAETFDPERARG